jgi:hypothetical protein
MELADMGWGEHSPFCFLLCGHKIRHGKTTMILVTERDWKGSSTQNYPWHSLKFVILT